MTARYADTLRNMPAMTPFIGPETLERRRGRAFRYRLGANESNFGMSPKALAALQAEAERSYWYCDSEHWEVRSRLAALLGVRLENIVVGEGIDGVLGVIVRAFTGPTVFDRILVINSFGTKTVLLIAVYGYLTGRPAFLDLCLVYALINSIGVIAVLRFFKLGRFHDIDADSDDGR